jgi:O-methyltransferase involved in polyketide biosynthesis
MTDVPMQQGSPQIVDPERAREIFQKSLTTPQVGRVYDFFLGGDANWAIDREFGKRVMTAMPDAPRIARQNRKFLGRAVRYMLDQGIRQFVDLGSGLPTEGNVHEVAEDRAPGECRVVYVDSDEVAAAHAQLLLEKFGDTSRHVPIVADAMDPKLLSVLIDHTPLDFSEPVGLLCVALLHFVGDASRPVEALENYRARLAQGSYMALSHVSMDGMPEEERGPLRSVMENYKKATQPMLARSRAEVAGFLGDGDGWDIVTPPGICWTSEWLPEGAVRSGLVGDRKPFEDQVIAGVARKR